MAEGGEGSESEMGECSRYCMRKFHSLKIMPCKHDACLDCLLTFYKQQKQPESLKCPTCSQMIPMPPGGPEALPARFFGKVSCDNCRESKDVKEFLWCGKCIKVFCFRCEFTEGHRALNHSDFITPWDSADGVKFCVGDMTRFGNEGLMAREQVMEKIDELLTCSKAALLRKLKMEQDDETMEKLKTTRELLQASYGIEEVADVVKIMLENLSSEEKWERMQTFIKKALDLALGKSDVALPEFQSILPPKIHGFKISPEEVADYLWNSAIFEDEVNGNGPKAEEAATQASGSGSSFVETESSASGAAQLPAGTTGDGALFRACISEAAWEERNPDRVCLCPSAVAAVREKEIGIWQVTANNGLTYSGSLICQDQRVKFVDVALVQMEKRTRIFVAYTKNIHLGILVGVWFLEMNTEGIRFSDGNQYMVFTHSQSIWPYLSLMICSDGVECFLGTSFCKDCCSLSGKEYLSRLDRITGTSGTHKGEIIDGFSQLRELVFILCMSCSPMGDNRHLVALHMVNDRCLGSWVALCVLEGEKIINHKVVYGVRKSHAPLACFPVPAAGDVRIAILTGDVMAWMGFHDGEWKGRVEAELNEVKKLVIKGGHVRDVEEFCFLPNGCLRVMRYLKNEMRPPFQIKDLEYVFGRDTVSHW